MAQTTASLLKTHWEPDLGTISNEDWEEALAISRTVSPKLSDRLTHLYILHRSYLTPHRISKYNPGHNPKCPRCNHPTSSFYHLLWTCPAIQDYWAQVVQFLHDRMGSPLTVCPRQCVLGLLSLPESEKYLNIFLQETLFLVRLQIAKLWLRESPPRCSNGFELSIAPFLIKKYCIPTGAVQTSTTKYGTDGLQTPPPAMPQIKDASPCSTP